MSTKLLYEVCVPLQYVIFAFHYI